jgi:hypothetical protein
MSGLSSLIAQYTLAFQTCPIILVNGIANGAQGNVLPITNFIAPFAGSTATYEYPQFLPIESSSLIQTNIGSYPFADMKIAANTVIQQPLNVSMKLISPVNNPGQYLQKLGTLTSMQNALQNHNANGGYYIVATPAFIYDSCLMTFMVDVTDPEARQVQIEWQLDFVQPILTYSGAQSASNGLMSQLIAGVGLPTDSNGGIGWSGTPSASPPNLAGIVAALSQFGAAVPSPGTATLSGDPSNSSGIGVS